MIEEQVQGLSTWKMKLYDIIEEAKKEKVDMEAPSPLVNEESITTK